MQASLQRSILRTRARHCCWVKAKKWSRHQASVFSRFRKLCATQAASESRNGTIAARVGKLMRAEMTSFADFSDRLTDLWIA